jgi:hypothetical protein
MVAAAEAMVWRLWRVDDTIDIDEIDRFVVSQLDGVDIRKTWGERSYFYNPEHRFAHGAYFLTIKDKDGQNDRASWLDRPGVFRLSMGLPKPAFIELLGHLPLRSAKGQAIEGPWDFTELDRIMPHPVYGWMGWIAVLNPSARSFDACRPLIAAAYGKAVSTFNARLHNSSRRLAPNRAQSFRS